MRFASEPLDETHDRTSFTCGHESLDTWLRDHALTVEGKRTGRSFVWRAPRRRVVAYYTIAAHVIVREDLPGSLRHGNPRQTPAVLLARLALDTSLHGQGLGGALLAEALGRIVAATRVVGARFVVVDSIDEKAAQFYEHHGFRRVPGGQRLVQKVSDIAAAIDE